MFHCSCFLDISPGFGFICSDVYDVNVFCAVLYDLMFPLCSVPFTRSYVPIVSAVSAFGCFHAVNSNLSVLYIPADLKIYLSCFVAVTTFHWNSVD